MSQPTDPKANQPAAQQPAPAASQPANPPTKADESTPPFEHHGGGHHSHKHSHGPHGHHRHRHHHANGEQEHQHGPDHPVNADNPDHQQHHMGGSPAR